MICAASKSIRRRLSKGASISSAVSLTGTFSRDFVLFSVPLFAILPIRRRLLKQSVAFIPNIVDGYGFMLCFVRFRGLFSFVFVALFSAMFCVLERRHFAPCGSANEPFSTL
jgi:hypothetical protein